MKEDNMNGRAFLLIFVAIVLVLFRWCVDSSENETQMVAGINFVALMVVAISVAMQTIRGVVSRIRATDAPPALVEREIKRVRTVISWATFLPLAIMMIVYVLWFSSTFWNDIISIIALFISLTEEDIAGMIVERYKI